MKGAYSVVAKSGSHASAIMTVEVIGKELIFTNIRWCPEAGEVSQVTGRFLMIGKYSYRDRAGRIVKGELEIVKLSNGQSYVREVENFIPNLVNRVDNVIDDVGNAALQEAEVIDEIVKTSNSITDASKKFWVNHEINGTKYLRQVFGEENVGRQITVDITLNNGQVITCYVDNMVKQGNIYKFFDSKSSIINNLGVRNVDDLIRRYSTINQKAFYNALKNGQVKSIKPRGQRAEDYFRNLEINGSIPNNLNIGNSIEFLVNDVAYDGYNIYKKVFNF